MTKQEQAAEFRHSGWTGFKVGFHVIGLLKWPVYLATLLVVIYAAAGELSWGWLLACFAAIVALEYLTKACFRAHLMAQGYNLEDLP